MNRWTYAKMLLTVLWQQGRRFTLMKLWGAYRWVVSPRAQWMDRKNLKYMHPQFQKNCWGINVGKNPIHIKPDLGFEELLKRNGRTLVPEMTIQPGQHSFFDNQAVVVFGEGGERPSIRWCMDKAELKKVKREMRVDDQNLKLHVFRPETDLTPV